MAKEIQVKNDDNLETVSFEEALSLTGVGRYNYTVFCITIYSLLAAAAEIFGVGVLVTAAQCDLDLDIYKKGLISSVPMLGVIVSAHFWGYIADTRGRKYCLTVTMLGTTVTAIISSFASHWIFLASMKFVSAGFASGTNAVIYAMLGETTPQSSRARFLLYSATCVMMSQFTISLLAYPILKLSFSYYIPFVGLYRPWRLLAATFGILSFVNFLLLHIFTLESPKYYFAKGDNENGLEILKKIYGRNIGKPSTDYEVKKIVLEEKVVKSTKQNIFQSMWNQTIPLFQKEHIKNTFLVSYISIVIYSFGPAFAVQLPAIFGVYSKDKNTNKSFCELLHKEHVTVQDTENNTLLVLPEVCDDSISDFTILALISFSVYMACISAVSVVLIKYTGKRWMFIGTHVMATCLCLTINLVNNIGGIAMFIAMLSPVLGMGIVTTYAVELFPTYLRAMAVCLTMMVGRAFSFIVINLIGPQLENNCTNFTFMIAAFLMSGAIVAYFLPTDQFNSKSNKGDKDKCEP